MVYLTGSFSLAKILFCLRRLKMYILFLVLVGWIGAQIIMPETERARARKELTMIESARKTNMLTTRIAPVQVFYEIFTLPVRP